MATRTLALLLILMMDVAAASNLIKTARSLWYGGTFPGCDPNTPGLIALAGGAPLLTVGGPYYNTHLDIPYWHIPHDKRPGPIRNSVMGCVTVNESLPQRVGPYQHEIRKVFLAPCNGKPTQNFIMPDAEWMQGCGGRIRWAVDEKFHLAEVGDEAVLRWETGGDLFSHKWYVDFWERSWVLTANMQFKLLRAFSGMCLVLLLFQAFRLLGIFFHVFKLFVDACLNHSMDIRLAALATVGCFATRAYQLIRSSNAHKDMEALNLYNSRRVARVQRAIWLMQPVLSLVLLGTMRSKYYHMIGSIFDPPEDMSPVAISRALVSTGLLPIAVLFAWATFFSACPRLLSARTLDCSNVALAVTWALQFAVVSQKSRKSGYNDTIAWMEIVQVLTAMVLGNAALASVLQVMLAAVHIHSHWRSNLSGGTYVSHNESVQQLTLFVLFLALIWLMDMETWAEAKATVRAKRADRSNNMVFRLLGSMCDAVVSVDEFLCVGAAGSQQLASLLMHRGSQATPPLRGVPLINVVKSEDHQRLLDFFARELAAARASFGAKAPIESSLHIHLRDACGISVPVELFCSCSLGADAGGAGPLQYLLGIKELDSTHPAFHSRGQGRESSLQDCDANMAQQQLGQISESDTSSSDDDTASDSSMVHMDLAVWVDVDSEHLTCIHCNRNAALLLQPPSQNARFLDWIERKHKQDVLHWLRAGVTESVMATKTIALRLPCQGGGGKRSKSKKRYFVCSVSENTEELPETFFPLEGRVARLDLQELTKAERYQPPRVSRLNLPHMLLWMDVQTCVVLKTERAPVVIFQEGSHVVSHHEANQESDAGSTLMGRIHSHILDQTLFVDVQGKDPSFLGEFCFVSEAYKLRAETTLLDWGEDWQGIQRSWCLLRLAKFRLFPERVSERN